MTARAVPQCICVRACSACSGDYEDPERTAWSETIDQQGDQEGKHEGEEEGDEDGSAGNAEQSASREGFPAREK